MAPFFMEYGLPLARFATGADGSVPEADVQPCTLLCQSWLVEGYVRTFAKNPAASIEYLQLG